MPALQAWLSNACIRFRIRALKALLRNERRELITIRRHLRPGDTACDIGANKGSFVYWLSRWVGNGRVVVFEPQPDLARSLASVCRIIGLANVTVEAKAVHSQPGQLNLYIPKHHQPGASLRPETAETDEVSVLAVPVVALDGYFDASEKIALLKIDVEGEELAVFRGAERILRSHGPLLVFECENRHRAPGSVEEVFGFLEGLGYEGSFVCGGELLPIAQFDAAVHQRQDGEWFWKRKDYCNNFVFRKPA
jgi:FkbM family methyltransferase